MSQVEMKLSELLSKGVEFVIDKFPRFDVFHFRFPDGTNIVHSSGKDYDLLWRNCPLCNHKSIGFEFFENKVVHYCEGHYSEIDPTQVHFCESCQIVITNYKKIYEDRIRIRIEELERDIKDFQYDRVDNKESLNYCIVEKRTLEWVLRVAQRGAQ